jgi:LPXTG-motif cell wall-anchored protein
VTPVPSVASTGSMSATATASADGLQDSDKQALAIVLGAVGAVLVALWLVFGRKKKQKVTA